MMAAAGVAPVVTIVEPNASTLFPLDSMITLKAAASDADGEVKRVDFYGVSTATATPRTNKLGESLLPPYSLTVKLTNYLARVLAVATDNSGLMATSAPVGVSTLNRFSGNLGFGSTTVTNPVTGYIERPITVGNLTSFVIEGVRLSFSNIPDGLRIVNPMGRTNDAVYFEYPHRILQGQRMSLVVEFDRENWNENLYVPYIVTPIPAQPEMNATGSVTPVSASVILGNSAPTDDRVILEVDTVLGATYAVQYSDDLVTWRTSLPHLQGTGEKLVWVDTGAPKTSDLPYVKGRRFYRVLRVGF